MVQLFGFIVNLWIMKNFVLFSKEHSPCLLVYDFNEINNIEIETMQTSSLEIESFRKRAIEKHLVGKKNCSNNSVQTRGSEGRI